MRLKEHCVEEIRYITIISASNRTFPLLESESAFNLLKSSNSFGTSCDVSADGEWISCQCREGYIGSRCEACSTGYYGKPEELSKFP